MWSDRQRRAHRDHWPDVERALSEVPPRLFRRLKLLEYDLALRHSSSGRFSDVFVGPDQFPLPSLAALLLPDVGVGDNGTRAAAEGHLFVAGMLLAVRAQALDAMSDAHSFADDAWWTVVESCSERASLEVAAALDDAAAAAEWCHGQLTRDREARLALRDLQADPEHAQAAEEFLHPVWTAPAQIIGRAAATIGGSAEAETLTIERALRVLAQAFQVRDELAALDRDAQRGWISYPVALAAAAAGMPLRPRPEPARLLGAMVATGTVEEITDHVSGLLEEAAACAASDGLATLAEYVADARQSWSERLPAADRRAARHTRPLVELHSPTLASALDMAARFLLSDPTLRESWETHREGLLGAPEVASRYPAGLVLEILRAHGHDVDHQVDALVAFSIQNEFRYYDHPLSAADSDTVGLVLRLAAGRPMRAEWSESLRQVLARIARQVRSEGAIPVWIAGAEPSASDRPPILELGGGCATVAAHLLLGTTAFAPTARDDIRRIGQPALVARLADVGIGANVNYPPLYALTVFGRLLQRLEAAVHDSDDGAPAVGSARRRLERDLAARLEMAAPTPQDAALATLACRAAGRPDLIDSRWQSSLLRHQRPDGSWPPEPFAAAPNRGGWASWYSSATLTTALCYDALAGGPAS